MNLSRDAGFSLIELMLGLAVSVAVSLSGAYIAVQASKVNTSTSLQSELNQEHLIALQQLKDIEGLLQVPQGRENGLIGNAARVAEVESCFSKLTQRANGTSCSTLNMAELTDAVDFEFNSCLGVACNFTHRLEYRIGCPATESVCSKIELRLTTTLRQEVADQKQFYAKARVSNIAVSSQALENNRAQIDFACANASGVVTGILFNRLEAVCNGYVNNGTSCANNGDPLRDLENNRSCQAMVSAETCTLGFKDLSLFQSSSTCNPGAVISTPVVTTPVVANCPNTAVVWAVGGVSCSGFLSSTVEGGSSIANDNNGSDKGTAAYSCLSGGTWSSSPSFGATCVSDPVAPATCPATTLTWVDSGVTCTSTVPETALNSSASISDMSEPDQGFATFACGVSGAAQWNTVPVSASCFTTDPNVLVDPCSEGGVNGNSTCQSIINTPGNGSACMKAYGRCDAGGGMCYPCDACPNGGTGSADGYCVSGSSTTGGSTTGGSTTGGSTTGGGTTGGGTTGGSTTGGGTTGGGTTGGSTTGGSTTGGGTTGGSTTGGSTTGGGTTGGGTTGGSTTGGGGGGTRGGSRSL